MAALPELTLLIKQTNLYAIVYDLDFDIGFKIKKMQNFGAPKRPSVDQGQSEQHFFDLGVQMATCYS